MKLFPASQVPTIRASCERDLLLFAREILDFRDLTDEVHGPLARFLERPGRRKLVLAPRLTYKTSLCTVAYSAWRVLPRQHGQADLDKPLGPTLRILVDSDLRANAKKMINLVRWQFEANPRLRQLWGDLKREPGWTDEFFTLQRPKEFVEPTFMSSGIDQVTVGLHFDLGILDDVVNDTNVNTKEQLEKTSHHRRLLSPILGNGEYVIIGCRWSDDDEYGRILRQASGAKLPEVIEELRVKGELQLGEWEVFFRTWQHPDGRPLIALFTPGFIAQQKRDLGGYFFCTPAETPILMADWSAKPINEVRSGDTVVGWRTRRSGRRELVPTTVRTVFTRMANLVRLQMASGRVIRCTREHRWYTGRGESDHAHPQYAPARVGGKLLFVVDPVLPELTPEQQHLALWLGGFYDGEGSTTASLLTFAQSRLHNPGVCAALEQRLTVLGFEWSNHTFTHDDAPARIRHHNQYWIRGGMAERRRFLLQSRPVRAQAIIDGLYQARFVQEEDEVLAIEPDVDDVSVFALQTDTGNYIAAGYCSSNSANYLNDPVPQEFATFKKAWVERYWSLPLPPGLRVTMTIDPPNAITAVGYDPTTRARYTLWAWRGEVSDLELIRKLFEMYEFLTGDGLQVYAVGLEEVALQRTYRTLIHVEEERRGYILPLRSLRPDMKRGGKEARIMALVPPMEEGLWFFQRDQTDLADELLRYPKARTRDLVDSLAYHLPLQQQLSRLVYPMFEAERHVVDAWPPKFDRVAIGLFRPAASEPLGVVVLGRHLRTWYALEEALIPPAKATSDIVAALYGPREQWKARNNIIVAPHELSLREEFLRQKFPVRLGRAYQDLSAPASRLATLLERDRFFVGAHLEHLIREFTMYSWPDKPQGLVRQPDMRHGKLIGACQVVLWTEDPPERMPWPKQVDPIEREMAAAETASARKKPEAYPTGYGWVDRGAGT